ncbi:hypothetical protein SDC9_33528 [bioreactor metagenome]|uniref:Uncharacterized protein n=1 Tax=bioreactor metagenome TaxID=1076179 RepID=A0A644V8J2_9ZZZZ|nr:hypothetical protein [Desulfitobacterium hafniense]MEA5024900.1 hypothetical protein [Desulfitobacterium hafniense]
MTKKRLIIAGVIIAVIVAIIVLMRLNNLNSIPMHLKEEKEIGLELDFHYDWADIEPYSYGNRERLTLPQLTVSWNWKKDNGVIKEDLEDLLKDDVLLIFGDLFPTWVIGGMTRPAYFGSGGSISSFAVEKIKIVNGTAGANPERLSDVKEIRIPMSKSGSIRIHLFAEHGNTVNPPDSLNIYYLHSQKKLLTGYSTVVVQKEVKFSGDLSGLVTGSNS